MDAPGTNHGLCGDVRIAEGESGSRQKLQIVVHGDIDCCRLVNGCYGHIEPTASLFFPYGVMPIVRSECKRVASRGCNDVTCRSDGKSEIREVTVFANQGSIASS